MLFQKIKSKGNWSVYYGGSRLIAATGSIFKILSIEPKNPPVDYDGEYIFVCDWLLPKETMRVKISGIYRRMFSVLEGDDVSIWDDLE